MAKRIFTVETVLSVVDTGLTGPDKEAFTGYLSAELGALRAELGDAGVFGGITLKGKGDKAKGVFDGGRLEFNGGHNTARLVIHFACLVVKQADTLGIVPPTVNVRPFVQGWLDRRMAKAAMATA